VGTAGGRINAPIVVLDYVEMLGFRVEKVEALVKDISEIGINSLIGWSLLKHFKTFLDPKESILEIQDP
jgi:predicted aspartyl protease